MSAGRTRAVFSRPEGGSLRRLVLYAYSGADDRVDDFVPHALNALRTCAERLVVVTGAVADDVRTQFEAAADTVLSFPRGGYTVAAYADALRALDDIDDVDEVVLTGDSWFGPMNDLSAVLARMDERPLGLWGMVENAQGLPESFPEQGFPARGRPWLWSSARREVFRTPEWRAYWDARADLLDDGGEELAFFRHFEGLGHVGGWAFAAADYPHPDPALFVPDLLLEDAAPFLPRAVFHQYPPFLDRHAVIGRRIVASAAACGYPMPLLWQNLARTVPPKTLNTVCGMLEISPDVEIAFDGDQPQRIVAVVHVSDLSGLDDLLDRLDHLPPPYDLVVTTSDGARARLIEQTVEQRASDRIGHLDVRVTPASRGRDMSDLFVGCRDIILGGSYDIIVKVHSRTPGPKAASIHRYFRRYQYDNLLNSPGYTANVLGLFQREPSLGAVFPPMIHLGYGTMGRAWADYLTPARTLAANLGIRVPFDMVSPLAPYGGMWICRPAALAPLMRRRWTFADYRGGRRGSIADLARVQERLVAYAAGEAGFHSRTVLTREHTSISHTALEYKVDEMFSTTRGYPVEQIKLVQRAGWAGYGGIVAIIRMYVRVNHPRLARVVVPISNALTSLVVTVARSRDAARLFLTGRRPAEDDG